MSEPVMVPTIHMNGTDRTELHNSYMAAMRALDVASLALVQTVPNGRDYYPQGPDAIVTALEQHWERVNCLNKARDELVQILEAINA